MFFKYEKTVLFNSITITQQLLKTIDCFLKIISKINPIFRIFLAFKINLKSNL